LLQLTDAQREELSKCSQSRTLPAGDVLRAKPILALADGLTWAQIPAAHINARNAVNALARRAQGSSHIGSPHSPVRCRPQTLGPSALRRLRHFHEIPAELTPLFVKVTDSPDLAFTPPP